MSRTDQPHKLSFETFVQRATDFTNPKNDKHHNLDYSRPETRAAFNGAKSTVPIWCNIHGRFFTQLVANHLSLGQGCPECSALVKAHKRRSKTWERDFTAAHGDTYDYSRVAYVTKDVKVEIICKQHGVFTQTPGAHRAGAGCPRCYDGRRVALGAARTEAYSHIAGSGCPSCPTVISRPQQDIASYLEGLGLRVQHNNRAVLGGLEVDLWLPDQNLGVEYHGLYWHSDTHKHRQKWEAACRARVRLVQVFGDEWARRRGAVEGRLAALAGVAPRLYARRLTLASAVPARAFLERYHTQGWVPEQESYGLSDGGRLVAVATFGLNRFGEGWEMLRYASDGVVVGGLSRLVAAFRKAHPGALLTSYCDLRYGNGHGYEAVGFRLQKITQEGYFWVTPKADKRISRFATQKRKLVAHPELGRYFSPDKTEDQICVEAGWKKVYDVGHAVYALY